MIQNQIFYKEVTSTLLIIIHSRWSSDVIKYLLSKGSNPNAQSVAGYTFLHFICGNPAKAKLIRTMLTVPSLYYDRQSQY